MCSDIMYKIECGMNNYLPVKVRVDTNKVTLPAWVDQDVLSKIKERDKLFKKRKTKWEEYKKVRNEVQRIMRKKKVDFVQSRLSKFKNNSSVIWSLLNNVIRKHGKSAISSEFIIDGIIETDLKKISNGFCTFFRDIAKNTTDSVKAKGKINPSTKNTKPPCKNPKCMYVFEPTDDEIKKIVQKLKNKTSSGFDGVSNCLLKEIYDSIKVPLCYMFKESLRLGEFPNVFKKAIVKPLFKKGNKLEVNNYRPISLLPVISKLLEQLMYSRVVSFINKCNLLYEGQYGFRKNRSTIDALTDILSTILTGVENNKVVILLMLDMSKAFDSLNHERLLYKLENMGIGGVALNWFRSYLCDRKLQVDIQGVLSREEIMHTGTAQGSNLGPLLYILYTNDMRKNVKFSESVIFADDTSLIAIANNVEVCKMKLKEDLIHLYNYFIENDLCLNLSKTCYLQYKRGQKIKRLGAIELNGITIHEVDNSKLLGLNLDNELKWESHVNHVIKKLRSSLFAMKISHSCLDMNHRLLLYYALFYSHLQYGIGLWGSMISKKNEKRLQVLQNHCIRIMYSKGKMDSV